MAGACADSGAARWLRGEVLELVPAQAGDCGLVCGGADQLVGRLAIHHQDSGDELFEFEELQTLLGAVRMKQGRFAEAETMFRQVLNARQRRLGDEDPGVLHTLNNLSAVLLNQGKLTEAEPLAMQALEMRAKLLGAESREAIQSLNDLARLLAQEERLPEAEKRFREVAAARKKALGPDHPDVAEAVEAIAFVLWDQNKRAEAESTFREVLPIYRKLLSAGDTNAIVALNRFACRSSPGRANCPRPRRCFWNCWPR